MHCPRCGVEQPQSDECIACGIIFTKYVESLGRDRDTIPPQGATPAPSGETGQAGDRDQPQAQPGAHIGPGAGSQSGGTLNPQITQPSGQHLRFAADPFAPPSANLDAQSPSPNPFTATQEQPADPYSQTRTGPVVLPDSSALDPFAPPDPGAGTATIVHEDPFAQPTTREEIPQVQVPTLVDPFAPPTNTMPTQPVLGSAYPPPSQTPTVPDVAGDRATTQMDPLLERTWEEQLAEVSGSLSGQISGNVHDLSTIPPESYAVSSPATPPVSATGDANYQAMMGSDVFAPEQPAPEPQPQPAPQVETEAPVAATKRARPSQSKFQRARPEEAESIHPVAALARVLGAIACLGIAVLMMVNGRGLMSVMPYIIMVAYGCAALWGLTTYKGKITVRQFAIEMCVLVAVTLTLRTASPEMFSVEPEHDQAPVRAVIKPHLPKNALGRYTERALEVLTAYEELAHPLPTTDAARVETLLDLADTKSVTEHYDLLTPQEQSRVDGIEERVRAHGPKLTEAVASHIRANGPDVAFRAEGRRVLDAQRELSAALLRAQGLRARILVVPDGVTSESMQSSGD